MRTSLFATCVFAVLISSAIAQDEPRKATAKENSHVAPALAAKPLTVSGKISADGRTLMTDIDSEWGISNAEILKGHEGHRVTMRCYVDTEKGRLQVLSIRSEEGQSGSAHRLSDSAFRR